MREIASKVDANRNYSLLQALELLQNQPKVRFDQSVEISLKLGVDPRKSDQSVRGTVALPHGTGRKRTVLVFAKGEKAREALQAGAEFAGFEEYYERVREGWIEFDAVVATPDMMREVGKLGKVLGPRGLMPSPKAGTVTNAVGEAVQKIKAGQVEFKLDASGVVNSSGGKLSFPRQSLLENIRAFVQAVSRARPPTVKGSYLKSLTVSSTMGPGLRVDFRDIAASV